MAKKIINSTEKNANELIKKKLNKMVTSMDVARIAGVSQTSVSRVFNPHSTRGVGQETKEKIIKVARELGYMPNFIARSMVSRKIGILGVVVGSPMGHFNNKVIWSLLTKFQKDGMQCLIFTVENGQDINIILQRVIQYQVDGIIIMAAALSNEMANLCIENNTPIILFNRFVPGLNASSVYCDNIKAGRIVGSFFGDSEFKKIAHVTYVKDTVSAVEKKIGFYGMLREYGINNIKEYRADYTYEAGRKVGWEILNQGNSPEAIFCTSDMIAMGIMDVARYEVGLKIPQDISIVGFDDIEMASWPSYNLTTVCQPIDLLVNNTIDTLTELINNKFREPAYKVVETTLIQRGTTIKIK